MRVALVIALAVALAGFTYLRLERTGTRGWLPLACRALAWSALGLADALEAAGCVSPS